MRNFNNAAGTQLASLVYLNVLIDDKSMNQHIIPKLNKVIFQMAVPADESVLESIHSLGTIKVLSDVDEVMSMIANAGFVVFVEAAIGLTDGFARIRDPSNRRTKNRD